MVRKQHPRVKKRLFLDVLGTGEGDKTKGKYALLNIFTGIKMR